MSVLIKGMQMPKNCEHCRFFDAPYCAALGIGIADMYGLYRPRAYCPLVKIVRCDGCRYWDFAPSSTVAPEWHKCKLWDIDITRYDYCSRGEER